MFIKSAPHAHAHDGAKYATLMTPPHQEGVLLKMNAVSLESRSEFYTVETP